MTPPLSADDNSAAVRALISELATFSQQLSDRNELTVHHQIDQFFYMQKCEELQILLKEYAAATDRLSQVTQWLDEAYCMAMNRWKSDEALLKQIQAGG